MKKPTQSGMTLIELTVVLLVLIALAGLVVPYMGGTSSKALCDATELTMQNLKKIIMEQYFLDTLGYFPKDTKAGTNYNLRYLIEKPQDAANGGWDRYDPETAVGWRGPYVQNGVTLSTNPDASFQNANAVHDNIIANQSQLLDAWGRPLILQVPSQTTCDNLTGRSPTKAYECARLVSAGSGSSLGIGEATLDTVIDDDPITPVIEAARNFDDRILYLHIPTPANDNANSPCSE
jgi:type II secretory pathway pseudopilin PulG